MVQATVTVNQSAPLLAGKNGTDWTPAIDFQSSLPSLTTENVADTVRKMLAIRIGQDRLDLWFGRASRWSFGHNELVVGLQNDFLVDCVRSFCWDELRAVVSEAIGPSTVIRVIRNALSDAIPAEQSIPSIPPTNAHQFRSPTLAGPVASIDPIEDSASSGPNVTKAPMNLQAIIEKPSHAKLAADIKSVDTALPLEPIYSLSRTLDRPSLPVSTVASKHESNRPETNWWSDFIPGPSSRLATTAAEMVLERPGTISPLLIHGPSGVGKSHLAKALGQQLRRRCGLRRTIVMTAEQFTIDYAESARGAGFASFRRKYRDVDAFILDDLHFVLGKQQTLNELRNTIDHLVANRKQVVLVADRSLVELVGLGSDLHARIAGGMTCGMDPIDSITRRELLCKLCQRHTVHLSESTIESLADGAGGDARAIFGIVFRLLTHQRTVGRVLSHDEALSCSLDLIRACQPVVRLADIEKAVCDSFRLDPKTLQTKGKTKQVSGPRMLAMFLARKHTRAAYSEIGQFFGNRQHSTVISAQKKVEQWIEQNETLSLGPNTVNVRDLLRSLESSLQVG